MYPAFLAASFLEPMAGLACLDIDAPFLMRH